MADKYRDIEFQSDSELYILCWLFELKDKGYVEKIIRAPELIIAEGISGEFSKLKQYKTKAGQMKGKYEQKSQTILPAHHYTAEFVIKWPEVLHPGLVWHLRNVSQSKNYAPLIAQDIGQDKDISFVEVKPDFDRHNMIRTFMVNQGWVWQSRRIYINLLQPMKLFKRTFTPREYLVSRVKRTERRLDWEARTVEEWLSMINDKYQKGEYL